MNTQHIKWGPIALIVTVIGIISLITLWQFKELVGATFLLLLVVGAVVAFRGALNEQGLRNFRYRPEQEEPLPREPQRPYLQQGAQHPYYRPLAPSRQYSLQGDIYRHEPEEVRD